MVDAPRRGWQARLRSAVQFPLSRMVIAVVFVGGATLLVVVALQRLNRVLPFSGSPALTLLVTLVEVLTAFAAYAAYVRLVERQPVVELAPRRAAIESALGLAAGVTLLALTVALIWLAGQVQVAAAHPAWGSVLGLFSLAVISGCVEELIARGIVFRILEEGLGTWWALLLSALVFGALHARNPNATVVSTMAIASSTKILLAAAYVVTRRLWLPIGLHVGWNFAEGGIFGLAVSGRETHGILDSKLGSRALISGGGFGVEASIFVVILGLLCGGLLLGLAAKRRRLLRPSWRNRRPPPEAG